MGDGKSERRGHKGAAKSGSEHARPMRPSKGDAAKARKAEPGQKARRRKGEVRRAPHGRAEAKPQKKAASLLRGARRENPHGLPTVPREHRGSPLIVKPSSVDRESPSVNGGRARQGVATEVGRPNAGPVIEVEIIIDLKAAPERHAERRRPRVQLPVVAFPGAAQASALRMVKPKVEPKELLRIADSKRRKKRH